MPVTVDVGSRELLIEPARSKAVVVREGPQGPANSLSIGTVVTGTPGSQAAASITGTPPAQVLDLTIPTGHTGPAGPAIGGILTSKGDLAVHNGTTVARLPVGGEGQSLTVSGGAPSWQPSRVGNLLTPGQAGTTAAAWFFSYNQPTITATASAFGTGSAISVTCKPGPTEVYLLGTHGVGNLYHPVTGGQVYTFSVELGNTVGGRQLQAQIVFFDASFASPVFANSSVTSSSGLRTVTAIAPPGAAYAYLKVIALAGADGDAFQIRRAGFWLGAGGDWAMPGEPILNQGRRVTRPNGTDRLVEVWDGTGWVVVHYDSGWRNITATHRGPTWTSGEVHIRRIGQRVIIRGGLLSGSPTFTTCWTVPTGWGPDWGYTQGSGVGRENYQTGKPYWFAGPTAGYGGFIDGSAWNSSYQISPEISWITGSALPSSLPGTLFGPVP